MRVVVMCADPGSSLENPDSAASVLRDLGCRIRLARFDLSDLLDLESEPHLLVVESPDNLTLAQLAFRSIRERSELARVPALLVVDVDRLSGLDFTLGFDDFVLSPLVPAELYARLRQLDWRTASFESEELIKLGELVVDVAGYEARLGAQILELTHQEFELLRFLAENRGRVHSRDELLKKVWGYSYAGGTRTVDIHVRRIRSKLGSLANLLVTVRGVGYKIQSD